MFTTSRGSLYWEDKRLEVVNIVSLLSSQLTSMLTITPPMRFIYV
jgi:hypothetical protein